MMQYFFQGILFFIVMATGNTTATWANENNLDFERRELLRVAHSLEKSLNELRALEKEKALQAGLNTQMKAPPQGGAMDQIVTIKNWEGPLEGLLKTISEQYHYKLNIIGKRASPPIFVSIIADKKTLGTVIQDADLQAGAQAHILVSHDKEPTIELRYV